MNGDETTAAKSPLETNQEPDGFGQPASEAEAGTNAANPSSDGAVRGNDSIFQHEIEQFARRLCTLFPSEIASDPRSFKKRTIEALKRCLPPFAGRPTEQTITRAAELKAKGQDWALIYPLVISDHARLDRATKRLVESNLRSAIRARRNTRRRRNRPGRLSVEASTKPNVSLS
jgi:hypothetical protein